jgi:hypothetical protein
MEDITLYNLSGMSTLSPFVVNSDYPYNDVTENEGEWNLVDTSLYTLSKIINAFDIVNASTSVSTLWLLILLL